MPSVFANGRSIVHSGDGQTNSALAPDVCKTPSPGGPVPIPYPNFAMDSDLADGAKKTKIEGNPVGLESSNLSTSTGDEAGTAGGGIVSSKTKGKMTWVSVSMDVKVEGKGVARFGDPTMHNGNMGNTSGAQLGGPTVAYGNELEDDKKCVICGKGSSDHPKVEDEPDRPTAKYVFEVQKKLQEDYDNPQARVRRWKALDAQASKYKKARESCDRGARRAKEAGNADLEGRFQRAKRYAENQQKITRKKAEEAKADAGNAVVSAGKSAYMLGTMMCESHKTYVYVTMSGFNLKGFDRVVNLHFVEPAYDGKTWEIVQKKDADGDNVDVSKEDFEAKNPMLTGDKAAAFGKAWDLAARTARRAAAPDPGTCAAMKLLTHGSHQPVALSEAYFSPIDKENLILRYVKEAEALLADEAKLERISFDTMTSLEFTTTQMAKSCQTCRTLLPFALCKKKESC